MLDGGDTFWPPLWLFEFADERADGPSKHNQRPRAPIPPKNSSISPIAASQYHPTRSAFRRWRRDARYLAVRFPTRGHRALPFTGHGLHLLAGERNRRLLVTGASVSKAPSCKQNRSVSSVYCVWQFGQVFIENGVRTQNTRFCSENRKIYNSFATIYTLGLIFHFFSFESSYENFCFLYFGNVVVFVCRRMRRQRIG